MQSSDHLFTETDTTNVQLDISGPRFAHVNESVMFSVISNVSVTNYKYSYIFIIIARAMLFVQLLIY